MFTGTTYKRIAAVVCTLMLAATVLATATTGDDTTRVAAGIGESEHLATLAPDHPIDLLHRVPRDEPQAPVVNTGAQWKDFNAALAQHQDEVALSYIAAVQAEEAHRAAQARQEARKAQQAREAAQQTTQQTQAPTTTATPTTTTAPEPAPSSGGIPPTLRRIRGCESGSGPNSPGTYHITNNHGESTSSGAYQFTDPTWRGYRGAAGAPYARAYQAPPAVQDQAAIRLYNARGTQPWNPSRHCWG